MPDADNDGIAMLADALLRYFAELKSYRRVCRRHEGTVTVEKVGKGVRIVRTFSFQENAAACLRAGMEGLPGWEQTLFWGCEHKGWERLLRMRKAELQKRSGMHSVVVRGIAWEGRAILACGFASAEGILHVDLLLPPLPIELPRLPLRLIACALRCHEHLLPASVALPLQAYPRGQSLTIAEFLRRTTPQNLLASQCFPLPGAEK